MNTILRSPKMPAHRQLGLIRRRDKEADPALRHVREALLELAHT